MTWLYTFQDTIIPWHVLGDYVASKIREIFKANPDLETLYISFDSLMPNPVKAAEQAKRASERERVSPAVLEAASPDYFVGQYVPERDWRRRILFPGFLRIFTSLALVGTPGSTIIVSGLGGGPDGYNHTAVKIISDDFGFTKHEISHSDPLAATFPESDLRIISYALKHLQRGETVLLDSFDGDTLTLGLLALQRQQGQLYWKRKNGPVIDLRKLYDNLKHDGVDILSFCCLVFATGNDFVQRTPRCTWNKLNEKLRSRFIEESNNSVTIDASKLADLIGHAASTRNR